MSTFGGKILEIPDISVDNFEGDNEYSSIYFLSHCHSDHMRGLGNITFQNSLVRRIGVYLYASPVSVKILKNMYGDKRLYPPIEEKLKDIPIHSSTLIKIPHSERCFTVTTLPAGHCPGSVMFLFEINEKNVLYTGDYRVSASDLEKYEAFYSFGNIKKIDKMYLDTTFFKLSYRKLPSRQESLKMICLATKEWIEQSSNHLVNIVKTAKYGSEFLFMEVAKEMEMPIHVTEDCYDVYKCIPEMDGAITLNADETQIHSSCGSKFREICLKETDLVRQIIPSTIWWEGKDTHETHVEDGDEKRIRICHSSHASFEEIRDFLLFLKPTEIEPCVVPDKVKEKNRLMQLLEEVMLTYKVDNVSPKRIKLFVENLELQNTLEEDSLDDLLHSPTNNFQRNRQWLQSDENEL